MGRPPFLAGAIAAAALAAALAGAPCARAEEGEGPGTEEENLQEKLAEQMRKIVRLMRENEAALLEASRGGDAAPKPVDVRPPEPPEGAGAPPPESGTPPPGETPPERSEEIRRKMDELIRGSTERGRSIPKELEELVRLIPLREQSSEQPQSGTPESEARRRDEASKKPEDGAKRPEDGDPKDKTDPKDPPKEDRPPPPSDAARADVPPWLAELPDEIRRRVVAGDFESVPAKYRALMARYQKWLSEQAGKTR